MTEKEMRELDAWVGENIFGGTLTRTPHLATDIYMQTESNSHLMMPPFRLPHYTTDYATALQVLEKCLKHHRPHGGIVFYDSQITETPCFTVQAKSIGNLRVQAETLPLAISKFAKELFRK